MIVDQKKALEQAGVVHDIVSQSGVILEEKLSGSQLYLLGGGVHS